MANTKISALPLASTPLAGTEVLPIVQGGITEQVAVSDLTAGRAVSAASLTLTSTASATKFIPTGGTSTGNGMYLPAANTLGFSTNGTQNVTLDSSGRLLVGNTSSIGTAIVAKMQATGPQSFITTNSEIAGWVGVNSNADNSFAIGADPDSLRANSYIAFYVDGFSEKARLNSSGNFICPGVYSATVGGTNRDVYVDNTGLLGYVSSIRASKTNILDITDTDWLLNLNPVVFNYRKKDEDGNYTEEADGPIEFGLIAEDTESVKPELCFYDEVDGNQVLRGISYSKLITPMLKLLQKQQSLIENLSVRVEQLEKK